MFYVSFFLFFKDVFVNVTKDMAMPVTFLWKFFIYCMDAFVPGPLGQCCPCHALIVGDLLRVQGAQGMGVFHSVQTNMNPKCTEIMGAWITNCWI